MVGDTFLIIVDFNSSKSVQFSMFHSLHMSLSSRSSVEKVKAEVVVGPKPGEEIPEGSHKIAIQLRKRRRLLTTCVTRYNVIGECFVGQEFFVLSKSKGKGYEMEENR